MLAFAGLGRPEKFFATLAAAGIDVRHTVSFADHHRFTAGEIAALTGRAAADGLALVTTEKDAVRMPSCAAADVLAVTLEFGDRAIERLLARTFDGRWALGSDRGTIGPAGAQTND